MIWRVLIILDACLRGSHTALDKSIVTVQFSSICICDIMDREPRFIVTPPFELSFYSAVGAVLNCVSSGSPQPTITWVTQDGAQFLSQPTLVDILPNNSVVFHPFSRERYHESVHSVILRCRATNIYGTIVSPPSKIHAVFAPDVFVRAEASSAIVGGTALVRCQVPSQFAGQVFPISWETPERTVYPSLFPDGRYHMLDGGILLIRNVVKSDENEEFICKTRNLLTDQIIASTPAKISVIEERNKMSRPVIINRRRYIAVREWSNTLVECIAEGTPVPSVRWATYSDWSLGGSSHTLGFDRGPVSHSAHGSAVLSLEAMTATAGESHVCIANNSLGIDRMTVEVELEKELRVGVSPPFQTVNLGSAATFTCEVVGPKASISWYKNGAPIVASGHSLISGHQLILSSVTREDAGMYQCMAERSHDMRQGSALLALEASTPVLLYQFIEQTLQPGPPVSLRCKAAGNPQPHISWTRNGLPLPLNGRLVVREGSGGSGGRGEIISQVNISHARAEDGGMYRCTATNVAGQVFHEANLNIYGTPIAVQQGPINAVADRPLELHCPVAGYPLTSFSWRKDSGVLRLDDIRRPQDGGTYSCSASTREGSSATGSVQVSVLVAPKISPFASLQSVVEGERKTLTCTVSKGDLPLTLTWLMNGYPVDTFSGISVLNLNSFNSVLSIERVARRHEAEYTCQAINPAATSSVSLAFRVNVAPRIEPFAFQEGLVEGMRTRVVCGVSRGDPPLALTWSKDGMDLSLAELPGVQVTVIDAFSSVLTVAPLQPLHAGRYSCEAANSASRVKSQALLVVLAAPTWVLEPRDVSVMRGHSLLVDCLAVGNPRPSIGWKKRLDGSSTAIDGYRSIDIVEPKLTSLSNGTLFVPRAELGHAGEYLCRASNDVTHIDKIITITVHSSPLFSSDLKSVDSRVGESAVIECKVWANPTPKVTWMRRGHMALDNHRSRIDLNYNPTGGAIATLTLSQIRIEDAGEYVCFASSEYGRNSQVFLLNVYEPPSQPKGLRVVSVESRSAVISWDVEQPKPTAYKVHLKQSGQTWTEGTEKSINPDQVPNGIEISPLSPASQYFIKITATNHLGTSPHSGELLLTTRGEKPGSAPRDLAAMALGPKKVKVTWNPPNEDSTHGTILGYHVGYADASTQILETGGEMKYNFTKVDAMSDSKGTAPPRMQPFFSLTIEDLIPFHEYYIVVQAFNSEGAGPMSAFKRVTTLEDVPGEAPQEIKCTTLSKESIQLGWKPPSTNLQHGALKGYRIQYEKSDGYEPVSQLQTPTRSTVINGLSPSTNYSVRINAYTSVGDGPWSPPYLCNTDEDVPGRPEVVRVVASGPGAFFVSWTPPIRKGGIITSYDITWKMVGSRIDNDRRRHGVVAVDGNVRWTKIENTLGSLIEVDVAAATKVGRGPPTSARVTLTPKFPAAIYSIGGAKNVHRDQDLTLPCGHVGDPQPRVVWKFKDELLQSTHRKLIDVDGTLFLQNLQMEDSGNYSCSVANEHGSNQIAYSLSVLLPPEPPLVLVATTTTEAIHVQWKRLEARGVPINGFQLNYRTDHESWTEISLHRLTYSYAIKNLICGKRYHIFMTARNVVGSSLPSKTLVAHTIGGLPLPPEPETFLSVNVTYVLVHTNMWVPQGCAITHLSLEYRNIDQLHWVQVARGEMNSRMVNISGLEPSTSYALRATAVSSPGTVSHTYHFTTLNHLGEAPHIWSRVVRSQWLSVRVLLPLLTSAVALVSSLVLVCYCVRKRYPQSRAGEHRGSERSQFEELSGDPSIYSTIRKFSQRDSQSDIPENAEEIYPYATFELPNSQGISDCAVYSVFHDRNKQRLDWQAVKVGHHRQRSSSHSRGACLVRESEDYNETLASDTEPALVDYQESKRGVSSRTESSNQLEDLAAMREHSVIYSRRLPAEVGLSEGNSRKMNSEAKMMARLKVTPQNAGPDEDDTLYGGGPLVRGEHIFQQRIHHNLLYHADSSSSPEPSPTEERRSFPRRAKAKFRKGDKSPGASSSDSTKKSPVVNSRCPEVTGVISQKSHHADECESQKLLAAPRKDSNPTGEGSETECDRVIVPPPRSYSDSMGIRPKKGRYIQQNSKVGNQQQRDYSIAV